MKAVILMVKKGAAKGLGLVATIMTGLIMVEGIIKARRGRGVLVIIGRGRGGIGMKLIGGIRMVVDGKENIMVVLAGGMLEIGIVPTAISKKGLQFDVPTAISKKGLSLCV